MTGATWLVAPALAAALATGCDRKREQPPTAPAGSAVPANPIPEITTIDWPNFVYELGSLGPVKATGGRADFRVVEDDDGVARASQLGSAADWTGFLELGVPVYVDLDGDGFDEAAVPFELQAAQGDVPRVHGAFVFTLRHGKVVPLGTITTPARTTFAADGHAIRTGTGARWTWDRTLGGLVEQR